MTSAPTSLAPLRTRQCLQLGAVLAVTAAVCLFLLNRLSRIGTWLPSLPVAIGSWEAVTVPLTDKARNTLGNPLAESREYHNPLEDKVTVQVVVPRTFDAYREPPDLTQDYTISAQRILPLLGADKKPVRAWVWQGRYNNRVKVLMFCWIQERGGTTRVFGLRGLQQSFWERLQLSLSALTSDRDRCIVRIYSVVHPADKTGAQARRNLEEIARGIYAGGIPSSGANP